MSFHKGFSQEFLIAGIVIALIGGLGFVYWQNSTKKSPDSPQQSATKDKEPAPQQSTVKTYSNKDFSFRYPSTGWKLESLPPVDENESDTASLKTDDFVGPLVVEKGSMIHVKARYVAHSLDAHKADAERLIGAKLADYTTSNVCGLPAASYTLDYEGTRHTTVISAPKKFYTISFSYPKDNPSTPHRATYESVIASFTCH